MASETWLQIPYAPKYEINQRGDVRNIKTGRIIKPWICKDRGNRIYFGLYAGEPSEQKNFRKRHCCGARTELFRKILHD